MLSLLILLSLSPMQRTVTEADYRDAVACAAATRVAETWSAGSDSLGERMLAEGYRTRAERLTGYAFQFGEFGALADAEIEADIDAARTEANRAVMTSATAAEFAAAKRDLFRAADACGETLIRFNAG